MPRLRTYVALLRGINVGAHARISMADLRALFEALGSEDVATYVQSGNVLFKSAVARPAELVGAIERQIARQLELDVRVVVRTDAQLAKIARTTPFGDGDPTKVHVAFLAARPEPARVRAVDAKQFDPDELRVAGTEVYLHYPNGYGRTKLSNAALEKQLGVAATTRNWRTVTKLAELARG
jgi:uncharacterized protein (DUF1697 family)